MSAFENNEKDDVEAVVSSFLENHTPSELLDIIQYSLESWERRVLDKLGS